MESFKKRRLVIKGFLINEVAFSEATLITRNSLTLDKKYQTGSLDSSHELMKSYEDHVHSYETRAIYPDERDIQVNSIMDFVPVSTKVLGKMGEGISHTLMGVTVMLTGIDSEGVQAAEFGSSEGILQEQVSWGKPGTPNHNDIIIHVDVTLKEGSTKIRDGINRCHELCDEIVGSIRRALKKLDGRSCDERHEFYDEIKPGGKKVVILKQVAGQGAMSDTRLLSKEPAGYESGRSIIDLGNLPVLLTPNEYRDGALRAMH
ncbi:proline reductase cluster protein PrdD [Sansalvadorimonas sp. 2012CJ34-2]|uniref:Proline reductase cluster protein PrdD n=1 Tax=Parendozoicomonas callyspongiae TaxID=2942213 RepID=A0ABT0PDF3_9GAMM|nr:proline reductase cluster protein PrdD [Sansalvadorimonas sp. 2012CJ34-2]MCL6269251.1 proline reductase cluster protein PrdD [Sansalvadorimonas sp. 2012CJ34-2]